MTAAEYEAAIARELVVSLVRERNRSETPIGKWRVQRVDRNWPAPSVPFIPDSVPQDEAFAAEMAALDAQGAGDRA